MKVSRMLAKKHQFSLLLTNQSSYSLESIVNRWILCRVIDRSMTCSVSGTIIKVLGPEGTSGSLFQ